MKKILLKCFLLAIGNHFAIFLIAAVITGIVAAPDVTDAEVFSTLMLVSLLTWFGMAAAILLTAVVTNKATLSAVVARSTFLWIPISVGWFLTYNTGVIAWFPIGMFISSFFLFYEFLVFKEKTTEG